MAELSEVTTAICLQFNRKELERLKNSNDLQDLEIFIMSEKFNRALKNISYGSNKDFIQGQSDLDPKNATKDKGKWEIALSNTAQGISAALGIKNWMRDHHNEPSDKAKKVFLTGDQWPKEISKFRLQYAGMNDYNSSDLVVFAGSSQGYHYYYGVSLKKKPKPQSASPTLINNAVSKLFETGAGQSFLNEMDLYRVKYFDNLIRSYDFKNLLNKNGIKVDPKHMKLSDYELIKTKPAGQSKAYIDLKGKNDEIRKWVNQQVAGNKNTFFKELKKVFESNTKSSNMMANILAERVLKISLNDALGDLNFLNDYYFGYALVTAVGEVNLGKSTMNIYTAETKDSNTVLGTLSKISKSNLREGYRFKFNSVKSESSSAAKIYFDLVRGNHKIMDLEIRYKGSFTSWPQFLGVISSDFEKILKTGKN